MDRFGKLSVRKVLYPLRFSKGHLFSPRTFVIWEIFTERTIVFRIDKNVLPGTEKKVS